MFWLLFDVVCVYCWQLKWINEDFLSYSLEFNLMQTLLLDFLVIIVFVNLICCFIAHVCEAYNFLLLVIDLCVCCLIVIFELGFSLNWLDTIVGRNSLRMAHIICYDKRT